MTPEEFASRLSYINSNASQNAQTDDSPNELTAIDGLPVHARWREQEYVQGTRIEPLQVPAKLVRLECDIEMLLVVFETRSGASARAYYQYAAKLTRSLKEYRLLVAMKNKLPRLDLFRRMQHIAISQQ